MATGRITAEADGTIDLATVLATVLAHGHLSLRAIAAEFTIRGIRTRRGRRWHVVHVGYHLVRQQLSTATPKT